MHPGQKLPVTVITGGSQGIGLALACEFAQRGHNLFLVARDQQQLEGAANLVRSKGPIQVYTLPLDLGGLGACPSNRQDLLV